MLNFPSASKENGVKSFSVSLFPRTFHPVLYLLQLHVFDITMKTQERKKKGMNGKASKDIKKLLA